MSSPLLNQRFNIPGIVSAAILSALAVFFELTSESVSLFTNPIWLVLLFIFFLLFADRPNGMEIRYMILVFAVSTGLFVVAQKTGKPLGEISLGSALGPRLGEVPILSGFLWLLPVLLTFSYTEKFSSSIYVRALLGGLFVLVASIFLCANAPFLDFIVWESGRPEILSYFTWFVGGFLFHFAGLQMQVSMKCSIAFPLFLIWLFSHVVLFIAPLIHMA